MPLYTHFLKNICTYQLNRLLFKIVFFFIFNSIKIIFKSECIYILKNIVTYKYNFLNIFLQKFIINLKL